MILFSFSDPHHDYYRQKKGEHQYYVLFFGKEVRHEWTTGPEYKIVPFKGVDDFKKNAPKLTEVSCLIHCASNL